MLHFINSKKGDFSHLNIEGWFRTSTPPVWTLLIYHWGDIFLFYIWELKCFVVVVVWGKCWCDFLNVHTLLDRLWSFFAAAPYLWWRQITCQHLRMIIGLGRGVKNGQRHFLPTYNVRKNGKLELNNVSTWSILSSSPTGRPIGSCWNITKAIKLWGRPIISFLIGQIADQFM